MKSRPPAIVPRMREPSPSSIEYTEVYKCNVKCKVYKCKVYKRKVYKHDVKCKIYKCKVYKRKVYKCNVKNVRYINVSNVM